MISGEPSIYSAWRVHVCKCVHDCMPKIEVANNHESIQTLAVVTKNKSRATAAPLFPSLPPFDKTVNFSKGYTCFVFLWRWKESERLVGYLREGGSGRRRKEQQSERQRLPVDGEQTMYAQ